MKSEIPSQICLGFLKLWSVDLDDLKNLARKKNIFECISILIEKYFAFKVNFNDLWQLRGETKRLFANSK